MTRRITTGERWVFGATAVILALMLIALPFLVPPDNLADFILMFVVLGLLFYLARSQTLPLWSYIAVFIVFIAHAGGVLGLFSTIPLGIGYDKWMHFLAGVGFTAFFFVWLPLKRRWQLLLVALLCLMGLAALGKIVEFTGTYAFGLNVGGLIAQGDGQPSTGSPLQKYDTPFDLIFNLGGAVIGLLLATLLQRERKRAPAAAHSR